MTNPKPDRIALAAAQARVSEMKQDVAFLQSVRANLRHEWEVIAHRIEALKQAIAIEAESVKAAKGTMSLIHCKACGETHDQDRTCARPALAASVGMVESIGKTQAWFRLADNPAPRGISVLMWFQPKNGQPQWSCVDCIENRMVQPPDFWAPIFPPNTQRPAAEKDA